MRSIIPIAAAVLLVSGCGDDNPTSPTPPAAQQSIADFVTAVAATDGTAGARMSGSAPAPGGGPSITATSSGTVNARGSDVVRLTGSAFQTIYMSVDGADGFFQLRLPAATSDTTIVATLAATIPRNSFTAVYRAANAAGAVGAPASVTNTVRTGSNTSTFAVIFGENPVPFRSSGCNALEPQGWYTTASLHETSGVMFRVNTLTQKLDGNVASMLAESFNSRFGACPGGTFTPGVIPANGAVCASVGVCTASSFGNYQFQISGTDANGQAATFDSPLLNFGARTTAVPTAAGSRFVFAIGPAPIR
jgi:hypothetical protein